MEDERLEYKRNHQIASDRLELLMARMRTSNFRGSSIVDICRACQADAGQIVSEIVRSLPDSAKH